MADYRAFPTADAILYPDAKVVPVSPNDGQRQLLGGKTASTPEGARSNFYAEKYGYAYAGPMDMDTDDKQTLPAKPDTGMVYNSRIDADEMEDNQTDWC
jgi:hypothetical protein